MRAAAGQLHDAVNAVRMQMDWRPIVGLTEDLSGTLIERVLATEILTAAVDAHNKDVKK